MGNKSYRWKLRWKLRYSLKNCADDRAMPSKIPAEAANAISGYLGLFVVAACLLVELGFGLPGILVYNEYDPGNCNDADILTYIQANGIVGCSAAGLLSMILLTTYSRLFADAQDDSNRVLKCAISVGCCLCLFATAHIIILTTLTVNIWSSSCRQEVPSLFDAAKYYAIACWCLMMGEPIFVAMCLFFGMKLDIQLASDKEKEAAAHVAASEDEKQQLLEAAIHYPDQ